MPKYDKRTQPALNPAQRAKRSADLARQQAQMDSITQAVYDYVRDYLQQYQRPPTIREISEQVYISQTGVYRHIDQLVGMGWLYREPNIPRSVVLGQYAPDYQGQDDDDMP